ncbi:hypothetical protein [Vibrio metschnikovii]
MNDKCNKMAQESINSICSDMESLLKVMERAILSGDDAEKEISAGITLLKPLVNQIKGANKAA